MDLCRQTPTCFNNLGTFKPRNIPILFIQAPACFNNLGTFKPRNIPILFIQAPACFNNLGTFKPRNIPILHRSKIISGQIYCCHKITTTANNREICDDAISVARRSANFRTSTWDFNFVQSLKSEYTGETYTRQANKLKEAVKQQTFDNDELTMLAQLELIDTVERLGIGYLFKNEIKRALDNTMNKIGLLGSTEQDQDLHAISLHFRLLRQHGYEISQDVFNGFMKDIEMGNWKPSMNEDDNIKGMLSLYEAAHLAYEGETVLDEAKTYTIKYLNDIINKENCLSPELVKQIKHSLELPSQWRMTRLEARWYIDNISAKASTINPHLLHLAKLDFNMVQSIYQNDLKELSSWWKDLGLGSELDFARDNLMEYFLWGVGITGEPSFSNCRKVLTKLVAFVTMMDDVYDVYGTMDELKLFTDAVKRWDVNAIESLPGYMQICFLAFYNTINNIAYDTLKLKHVAVVRYLQQAWVDLINSFLVEAEWYYNKYTPSFEEYISNAMITIGGHVLFVHAYFIMNQEISEDDIEYLESYPDLIIWSSMVLRLCNDLETSKDEIERGDVPKSIQCYMKDYNVSEEVAVEEIRNMVSEAWKKMNKELKASESSKRFTEFAVNFARATKFIYKYGNGYSSVDDLENNEQISALLVDPIPLEG